MTTAPTVVAPVLPPGELQQVTDGELKKFAELIYERTGIRVSPQKKTLLSNRLRRRLRVTGIKTFGEYFRHLKGLRSRDPEWDGFLQEITTHETYLFRDEAQWKWFRDEYLSEISNLARAGKMQRKLRVWSAACSTGDEAFTVATCIAAALTSYSQWNITILGTDIGTGAVEQAQTALFGERAMRLVRPEDRRRFFTKAKDADLWQARPALTDMTRFRQHNLLEPLREPPFDLVILKNVLIYFDPASKKTVMNNIRAMVRPGGLMIAGAAEGVADMLRDFDRLHPWLYRKPATSRS